MFFICVFRFFSFFDFLFCLFNSTKKKKYTRALRHRSLFSPLLRRTEETEQVRDAKELRRALGCCGRRRGRPRRLRRFGQRDADEAAAPSSSFSCSSSSARCRGSQQRLAPRSERERRLDVVVVVVSTSGCRKRRRRSGGSGGEGQLEVEG